MQWHHSVYLIDMLAVQSCPQLDSLLQACLWGPRIDLLGYKVGGDFQRLHGISCHLLPTLFMCFQIDWWRGLEIFIVLVLVCAS